MIGEKFRTFLLTFRQGILVILGGIEEYLEMERSVIPQHKKNKKESSKAHIVKEKKEAIDLNQYDDGNTDIGIKSK